VGAEKAMDAKAMSFRMCKSQRLLEILQDASLGLGLTTKSTNNLVILGLTNFGEVLK
jgi:hypothetical protein